MGTVSTSTIMAALHYNGAGIPAGSFTYSIPTDQSTWPGYAAGSHAGAPNVVTGLNATQTQAFQSAVAAWDGLISPSFTQQPDTPTPGAIRIAFTSDPAMDATPPGGSEGSYAAGSTYINTNFALSDSPKTFDIWLNDRLNGQSFAAGSTNYKTMMHELGHALGLDHSFGGDGGGPNPLPAEYDNWRYTIMSYTTVGVVTQWTNVAGHLLAGATYVAPTTPMLFDVIAVQQLYGADPNTASGDTVYTFDQSKPTLQTIYDAGGNDTIDLSTHTRASVIDLTPGAFSSVDVYTVDQQIADTAARIPGYTWTSAQFQDAFTWQNNLAIAPNTVIENVKGGSGADSILGNDANNNIDGGVGDDTISGGAGQDYLRGGDGADSIVGGADFDDINGNKGNDTLYGNEGNDWVAGGQDQDLLFGENGDDVVYGNIGADTMSGGAGNDWMRGGQGDDLIDGGAGNDLIWGDRGDDTITGGSGADMFHTFVGAGSDRVTDFNGAEGDRVVLDDNVAYTVTASQSGSDTVITLKDSGDTVTLQGVALSSFQAGWVIHG